VGLQAGKFRAGIGLNSHSPTGAKTFMSGFRAHAETSNLIWSFSLPVGRELCSLP